MAKEDNLIQNSRELTPTERRERASKAGKASVRARQRKKKFREELEMLLPMTDLGKDGQPVINPITGRKQSIQQTITMQLLLKARKGDTKAVKLILETLGERLLKTEESHDVTVHHSRYDNMTDEELQAENKRLDEAISKL